MENMQTITTPTGRYTFQPERDLPGQLAKADKIRKKRLTKRLDPVMGPAWGSTSILGRTITHIKRRLENEPGWIEVSLFRTSKKQALEFNREIAAAFQHNERVVLRYVDPASWGF